MKKFLLVFTSIFCLAAQLVQAQTATFTTQSNSVTGQFVPGTQTEYKVYNRISATGPDSVELTWKVIGSDFPADWLDNGIVGVCDNVLCYTNFNGSLWNGTSGGAQTSNFYRVGEQGDFHLVFTPDGSNTSTGTHYITVNLKDNKTNYSKDVTFNINYTASASVNGVKQNTGDMVIYPNPVRDQLNVVFNGISGVRNIAVYNLIGRAVSSYRVGGSSAAINVESLPSGIYFVRLLDANGSVVATRKFTRM